MRRKRKVPAGQVEGGWVIEAAVGVWFLVVLDLCITVVVERVAEHVEGAVGVQIVARPRWRKETIEVRDVNGIAADQVQGPAVISARVLVPYRAYIGRAPIYEALLNARPAVSVAIVIVRARGKSLINEGVPVVIARKRCANS